MACAETRDPAAAASRVASDARRAALEEVRDRMMSLEADASEVNADKRTVFHAGFAAHRTAAQALITGMLSE
jgi:hypothetical protein